MRGMAVEVPEGFEDEFQAAVVCERMGWTWDEYLAQPERFIRVIIERMAAERRVSEERRTVL